MFCTKPIKGRGELHLPLKDTVKMIQKPREGSDDESTHTENRALETGHKGRRWAQR